MSGRAFTVYISILFMYTVNTNIFSLYWIMLGTTRNTGMQGQPKLVVELFSCGHGPCHADLCPK